MKKWKRGRVGGGRRKRRSKGKRGKKDRHKIRRRKEQK